MQSAKIRVMMVAGARPNFIKIAPLLRAFRADRRYETLLVHTGQHFDARMSDAFFKDLNLPTPDISLGVGGGSHAEQTARILVEFEKTLLKKPCDLVIVVGDVTSTLACALAACKLNIPVAHVEAGLRSMDRTMPEEHNRVVVDAVSDYWFVSEPDGLAHLRREGKPAKRVFYVGNVMIDSLRFEMPKITASKVLDRLELASNSYGVLTLHRPSNVDSRKALADITALLRQLTARIPMVFPVHPRTRARAEAAGEWKRWGKIAGLKLIDPLGYIEFVKLVKESRLTLTDSGGIQEETTVLGVPCLTMRDNTERPVTITQGTGELVGRDMKRTLAAVDRILANRWKRGGIPRYWDGDAAARILQALNRNFKTKNRDRRKTT